MSVTSLDSRKNGRKRNAQQAAPAVSLPSCDDSPQEERSTVVPLLTAAASSTALSCKQSYKRSRIEPLTTPLEAQRALRVMIVGIRGFPNVQGGVEKHAEKLADALSRLGCDIEAIVRSEYVPKGTKQWRSIKILRLWNSRTKGVETFLHTLCGVLYAAWKRPDILHIHGIGPAIFTPIARALGLRIVVTYHSLNYEHAKWGRFARKLLRFGEWVGIKFSHSQIAVSNTLTKLMNDRYGARVVAIPNGLDKPHRIKTTQVLDAFGLSPNRYALIVARIDEAKRQLDLVKAYAQIKSPTFKLAVAGEADHFGQYARAVADAAQRTPGVVMVGRQTGDALAELYTHAGVFVLPSSHEGQPIAVLEAASFGLSAILSDIPAHRELGLAETRYFEVGDVAGLGQHLTDFFSVPTLRRLPVDDQTRLVAAHDWDEIARRTLAIYFAALSKDAIPEANVRLFGR